MSSDLYAKTLDGYEHTSQLEGKEIGLVGKVCVLMVEEGNAAHLILLILSNVSTS